MRILPFKIENQRLIKNGDFKRITRGSKQYLQCHFSFASTEWNRSKIVAIFEYGGTEYPVAVEPNHTCLVPDKVTDFPYFKLKLLVVNKNTRIYTNKVLIEQEG